MNTTNLITHTVI